MKTKGYFSLIECKTNTQSLRTTLNMILIHKKRHPKSYHSDIKYQMTLNITFGVMFSFPKLTSPNTKAASSMRYTTIKRWRKLHRVLKLVWNVMIYLIYYYFVKKCNCRKTMAILWKCKYVFTCGFTTLKGWSLDECKLRWKMTLRSISRNPMWPLTSQALWNSCHQ